MTKTPENTPGASSTDQGAGGLFNASGLATRLRASPLLAFGPSAPGPALRRGALIAVPIGLALAVELGFNAPTKGAIATGALIAGFPGLDAPARPRAAWQAAAAPLIGIAAALGVLSSQSAPVAVLAMGLVGAAAGYCFSVSLRLAITGLSVSLALMIGQGLFLEPGDAAPALLYATLGGLSQAVWSLLVWLVADRAAEDEASGWSTHAALAALRSNLTLRSAAARHAIRFGLALAAGVALYWLLGMKVHGFWIPLTILFVMRPERDETYHRLALRALGTVLGIVVATALAEAFTGNDLVVGLVLTVAAALTFGLLTVQYALFTAAITTYVVLLSDTLGEGAFEAAGQRLTGTALGILIAFLAFVLWPNPGDGRGGAGAPRRVRAG
ncbi:MAG TPA: FUSC family protein [Solirubrobacterales bacterium]|nr:FUSC family protein [Solirubrobacterales bacterium]